MRIKASVTIAILNDSADVLNREMDDVLAYHRPSGHGPGEQP